MQLGKEHYWIKKALELAQKALPQDVPVGALILDAKQNLIATAWNQRETNKQISAHAEILALEQAGKALNNWQLLGCTLYVTLEPCLMCTQAILQARLSKVVFGAFEPADQASYLLAKAGIQSIGGILEDECATLLKNFFQDKRVEF
jgi:tRNA(adenine34) deaminase